jgi:predicted nucleotidyltransferase
MTDQTILFLGKIKDSILEMDPDAKLFLFGSRARGDSRKDSDWDILVLLKRERVDFSLKRLIRKQMFRVELDVGQPISTFVFSQDEWANNQHDTPLFKTISSEGIPL